MSGSSAFCNRRRSRPRSRIAAFSKALARREARRGALWRASAISRSSTAPGRSAARCPHAAIASTRRSGRRPWCAAWRAASHPKRCRPPVASPAVRKQAGILDERLLACTGQPERRQSRRRRRALRTELQCAPCRIDVRMQCRERAEELHAASDLQEQRVGGSMLTHGVNRCACRHRRCRLAFMPCGPPSAGNTTAYHRCSGASERAPAGAEAAARRPPTVRRRGAARPAPRWRRTDPPWRGARPHVSSRCWRSARRAGKNRDRRGRRPLGP